MTHYLNTIYTLIIKMYYCVLDFEATCWDSSDIPNKGKPYEIIEFPSVLFKVEKTEKGSTLKFTSEFQRYCKPVQNPKLSEFCTKLTGIEQHQVQDADEFPTVLKAHYDWLIQQTGTSKVIFITCGSWDFENALNKELFRWINNHKFYCSNKDKLYNFIIDIPNVYKSYINLKDIFKSLYNVKPGGMVSMLNYLHIDLTGRHHCGLHDCRNIGKILQKVYIDGSDQISKHFPIKTVHYKHKDPRPMWAHNPKFKIEN
ncbi:MAG: exonuclease [Hyperionvirus sp.]|uniref:Exonuclease n=1 Tax=Hyperionvirus sp. TaxID=2487770 RepID=A0A3G5AB53_9VIRU|nr:MAG: exonuclease [Hyperionvirus sp.]